MSKTAIASPEIAPPVGLPAGGASISAKVVSS
jgi:hypothetical protein